MFYNNKMEKKIRKMRNYNMKLILTQNRMDNYNYKNRN